MICGYISKENPFEDRYSWSGLIFKIREAIENAGYEVKWIPFKDKKGNRIKDSLLKVLSFPSKTTGHNPWASKSKAESIDINLLSQCDFLFIPSGSEIIPYITTNLPIIIYGDATYALMDDYYFHGVSRFQLWLGNWGEKKAIKRANVVCKASRWAINSVINDYGGNPAHSYVLKFGANIENKDITPIRPWSPKLGGVNFLFSGVDWIRKGGDIAVQTIEMIRSKGIDAKLLICGIKELPEYYKTKDFIENVGFLNKNNNYEYRKYLEAIKKSHIFLLPTKAECAGIVFSEASAFGLPIFTYDTGGVGDYVINGRNGWRLPLESGPEEFCEKILKTLSTDTQLNLHNGGINLYNTDLSWDSWSLKFKEIVDFEIKNSVK